MLETDRAAMAARLEALERVIEGARAIAPYRGELDHGLEQDAAGRIDRLLRDTTREIVELRRRVRLPTAEERIAVACVPLLPG
jgi:hypothetical protein